MLFAIQLNHGLMRKLLKKSYMVSIVHADYAEIKSSSRKGLFLMAIAPAFQSVIGVCHKFKKIILPWKATLVISLIFSFSWPWPLTVATCLSWAQGSPVKLLSSAESSLTLTRRTSAGTRSPTLKLKRKNVFHA